MVELARERHPSADCRVSDLWHVTADQDGQFDLVLSVNTLHHLGPDPASYLAHVRRLVRPGGHVVVIDCLRHTLSRARFHAEYGTAFPGASFTDTLEPSVCAVAWHAPTGPRAR